MSQTTAPARSDSSDPYEIGWYIESADEEVYGPISRTNLRRFLEDQTISPNTLVRHCTEPEARPAAEQPLIMKGLSQAPPASAVGDRLDQAWPKKNRDRQALAEDGLPCAWHNRPAVLVCQRCQAPYCNKCRAKPFRKQFYFCRRCQASIHNRRFLALMVDNFVLILLPIYGLSFALIAMGTKAEEAALFINILNLVCVALLFFRDSLFGGSGIGKRMVGLKVVQTKDGRSPLTFGQGIVRWLSQFIPIFNLLDAIVPYSDPLTRRYGDRWAGTRVLDREGKLLKARAKVAQRLLRKGVPPVRQTAMTMDEFARLA